MTKFICRKRALWAGSCVCDLVTRRYRNFHVSHDTVYSRDTSHIKKHNISKLRCQNENKVKVGESM